VDGVVIRKCQIYTIRVIMDGIIFYMPVGDVIQVYPLGCVPHGAILDLEKHVGIRDLNPEISDPIDHLISNNVWRGFVPITRAGEPDKGGVVQDLDG
jgi:hypothetical protein